MADGIRATPYSSSFAGSANDILGGLLGYLRDPRRTQQLQGLAGLLESTGIPKTVERMAYGEPLTNLQQANVPTLRPETAEALLSLLPVPSGTSKAAMATGRAGERLAERVVPQVMERGGMPAGLLEGMSSRTVSPLTVYHGSPARFERFDPIKIGSGEGAQAYGYGHYVAESPDVARRYQMGLTQAKGEEVLYKNKPLTNLYNQIENKSMKLSGKAADIENQKLQLVEHMMLDKPPQELIPYAKETGFDKSVIDWLEKDVAKNTKIPGAFYEIDLPDEQIARMLDLDKPLSKQPQAVQSWLKDSFNPYRNQLTAKDIGGNEPTGSMILNKLQELMSEGRRADAFTNAENLGARNASQELLDYGIPGIRYMDEASRGQGQGTSNFVVFPGNEDLLTILKRNGGLLEPQPKNLETAVTDASEIFGQGAKRIKYTDPNSGGVIDVLQRPDGTASVLGLEVPEAMRGQGIGQSLQSQVMQDFPEMMGQVSSKAAAKTAYRLGRRPPNQPEATLEDVYKIMDDYSSVNLVSPEMQKRFIQSLLD